MKGRRAGRGAWGPECQSEASPFRLPQLRVVVVGGGEVETPPRGEQMKESGPRGVEGEERGRGGRSDEGEGPWKTEVLGKDGP